LVFREKITTDARYLDLLWNYDPNVFADHPPPHFHAEYQGEKATFTFNGELLAGNISSKRARRLIREWALLHQFELVINWRNVEQGRPLNRIEPLD
jgi:uncharacterized protein DUF4160